MILAVAVMLQDTGLPETPQRIPGGGLKEDRTPTRVSRGTATTERGNALVGTPVPQVTGRDVELGPTSWTCPRWRKMLPDLWSCMRVHLPTQMCTSFSSRSFSDLRITLAGEE